MEVKRTNIAVLCCIALMAVAGLVACSGEKSRTGGELPAVNQSESTRDESSQREKVQAESDQSEVTKAESSESESEKAENEIYENVVWNETEYNTTQNGKKIKYILHDKKVQVKLDGETVFETQDDYYVSDLLVYDVDADGVEDMCLLLWKKGVYGKYRPIWETETEDEDKYSQHLFAYEWRNEEIKPKWMSSRLGMIVDKVFCEDNRLHFIDTEGKETVWVWISWGFELYE